MTANFFKGQRVQLSETGRQELQEEVRSGTVTRTPKLGEQCVAVMWDDYKTARVYHAAFIKPVQESQRERD